MEEMIARWIRETNLEFQKAKQNQNLFKMKEMYYLDRALKRMRDDLVNSMS